MRRNIGLLLGALLLAWIAWNLALGPSTGGVELNSNRTGALTPQPECTTVHTYNGRGWSGHDLVRSDVWLTGCKNAAGQMRIQTGPTCSATSFLGPGSATCSSSADGSSLRVTVTVHYPFGLDSLASMPATTTFRIDSGGGYNAP